MKVQISFCLNLQIYENVKFCVLFLFCFDISQRLSVIHINNVFKFRVQYHGIIMTAVFPSDCVYPFHIHLSVLLSCLVHKVEKEKKYWKLISGTKNVIDLQICPDLDLLSLTIQGHLTIKMGFPQNRSCKEYYWLNIGTCLVIITQFVIRL